MEQMVIDAVEKTPTTTPPTTAHSRSRDQAQTPGPGAMESQALLSQTVMFPPRLRPKGPEIWTDLHFIVRLTTPLKWLLSPSLSKNIQGQIQSLQVRRQFTPYDQQKRDRLQSTAARTQLLCNFKRKRMVRRAKDP